MHVFDAMTFHGISRVGEPGDLGVSVVMLSVSSCLSVFHLWFLVSRPTMLHLAFPR
jgi:hypothetical protein